MTPLVEETERLRRENLRLAEERAVFIRYIREKGTNSSFSCSVRR